MEQEEAFHQSAGQFFLERTRFKSSYSAWLERNGYHDLHYLEEAFREGYAQGKFDANLKRQDAKDAA